MPKKQLDPRQEAPSDITRTRMKAVRRAGTRPELALQTELSRLDIEFQKDVQLLPTERFRPDIVIEGGKVAVFVHGCFWHSCPIHATLPKTNTAWWIQKLEANRRRDRRAFRTLRSNGWSVLRVWEHDDMRRSARRVAGVVRRRGDLQI